MARISDYDKAVKAVQEQAEANGVTVTNETDSSVLLENAYAVIVNLQRNIRKLTK